MTRAIHWFRRDLRIHDNTALSEAARLAEELFPVFIVEDAFRTGPDVGAARLQFLLDSLAELRETLAALGYPLIIRFGKSEIELPKLATELGAGSVFANTRYEPYAQKRDARVFNALNAIGVGFECFKDAVIWHEHDILTKAGKPFTVFTPYSKAWKARKPPHPRATLSPRSNPLIVPAEVKSESLPRRAADLGHPNQQKIFAGGERSALSVLEQFLAENVFTYSTGRDRADLSATSQLSAHLRAGTIGVRTILARLHSARAKAPTPAQASCDVFLNELIWREFYLQVLHNFPHVAQGSFRREYDALQWSNDKEYFSAWCNGMTGFPIVDAAMRCMNATGWMHNRLRMVVAMFLTKDLLINWQWGERYFMQQLVDGDMAANNGGWQWSAGTGTDAAPYFRIFNPTSQAAKCDPNGDFVRRWVPELAPFGGDSVHTSWDQPLLAPAYPSRIVRHEEQRPKALAMFAAIKKRPVQ